MLEKIVATLIELLEDQEGVKITYKIEENGDVEDKTA